MKGWIKVHEKVEGGEMTIAVSKISIIKPSGDKTYILIGEGVYGLSESYDEVLALI